MKKSIFLIVTIIFLEAYSIAQSTLTVSHGTSPTIDGIISTGEWNDATIKTYQVGTSPNIMTVTVYIKHNGSDTLYIAQNMPNMLSGDRDLVMFDKNNNGGSYPLVDDFMLNKYHCLGGPYLEGQANGSDWNWITPSGWICALTGSDYSSNQGQIEFAISFAKLGITSGIQKTIGFGIIFGDYQSPYDPSTIWGWPANRHPEKPNTWGDMIISFTTDINGIAKNNEINIFPNPANNKVFIVLQNYENALIKIINIEGQLVKDVILNSSNTSINLDNLEKGLYFLQIYTDKEVITKKLIKE